MYYISKVDLFGIQPKLFFNNKDKYQTVWGGILTLILLVCFITACWIYGKDLYYREHPSTTFSEIPTTNPQKFVINKNTFNFSFGLQDSNKIQYLDESYYYLELYQFMMVKEKDQNGKLQNKLIWRDLEARKCTKSDFQMNKEYFLQNQDNLNMYCINYDIDDIYLEGIWGSDNLSYIQGRIYPCIEGKNNKRKCKPEKEVYEMLTDNQYSLNFSDQIINPLLYKEPFQTVGRNMYGIVNWDTYSISNFYFQNISIEDNTGIIFNHIEKQTNLQYTYENTQVKPGQHKDKLIMEFNIRFQQAKEALITRKYLNLAQVLANVGGILKFLMIGFAFISWYISNKLYLLTLANQVFNFQLEDYNNKSNSNSHNNSQQKLKQQQQKKLTFQNYLYLIFPFFQSQETKEKKEFLQFAKNKLTQRLNLNYMLEKFVEIEKIKLLLLDNNQLKLFDYISKPNIDKNIIKDYKESNFNNSMNTFNSNSSDIEQSQEQQLKGPNLFQNILIQENKSLQTKRKNCINAFKNISIKQNKNPIDDKMLNYVDESILLQNDKDKINQQIQKSIQKSQIYSKEQSKNDNLISLQRSQQNKIKFQDLDQLDSLRQFQSSKRDTNIQKKPNNSDIFSEIKDLQLDNQYIIQSKICDLPDSIIRNSVQSKSRIKSTQYTNSPEINIYKQYSQNMFQL